MEDNKKPSSLPANYVTLVQLQERWLKEKERKLKEKEQQEKRKEKQQKQQQKGKLQAQNAVARRSQPDSKFPILCRLEWNQRNKPEASVSEVEVAGDNKNVDKEGKSVKQQKQQQKGKLQAQNAVARRSQPDSKSPILCRLESNQRDKPEASVSEVEVAGDNKNVDKEGKSVKQQKQQQKGKLQAQNAVARRSQPDSKSPILCRLESNQRDKPEASVSEVEVAGDNKNVDKEGKSVSSKKRGKRKKYPKEKKNPNLAVEDEVTEKDRVVQKPPANEEKEDMPGTRNKESRGMEGEFRAKSSNLNQTKVEIETRFRDLSVNASNGNGYNEMKRSSTYNDRGKQEFRGYGSGKFCRREVRKPRDAAGLIWVKKGELFDDNVGRMQTLEASLSVSGQ